MSHVDDPASGFHLAVAAALAVVSSGEWATPGGCEEYFSAVTAVGDLLVHGGLTLSREQQEAIPYFAEWFGMVDGTFVSGPLELLAKMSPRERVPYLLAQARAEEADLARFTDEQRLILAGEYEKADRLRASVIAEQIANAPKRMRSVGVERRLARNRNTAPRDSSRRRERKFRLRQDDV
jgi:hypothetical protein